MKTKRWLWITLISILTLVVLVGVGAAGYRLGLTQNPEALKQFAQLRAQRFNQLQNQNGKAVVPQQNPNNGGNVPQQNFQQGWMMNPHGQGFDPRGDFQGQRGFDQRGQFNRMGDRGRRGGGFFFGALQLLVLLGILWLIYKFVKNSGWKIVREVPQPAPTVAASAPVEEKKQDEA